MVLFSLLIFESRILFNSEKLYCMSDVPSCLKYNSLPNNKVYFFSSSLCFLKYTGAKTTRSQAKKGDVKLYSAYKSLLTQAK